jgi:hypothetical protein
VSAEDWDTAERTAPALEPGSADSILFGLDIKGRHRNKSHQFEMSLDPDRIILELDETNNLERTRRLSIGRWNPPLWAMAAVGAALLAAAVLVVRRRRRIRERKAWQETAIDGELPEACEPCTRMCRRIEAELEAPKREMSHLALHAMDPGSGISRRRTVVRGKGVARLNQAIAAYRGGAKLEELEAQVKPLAESLAREIVKWLHSEGIAQDVRLVGYLQGGRVTYEYTVYHCKRVGMENVWDEEDTWRATVEDERAENVGTLSELDPASDATPAMRVEELVRFLIAFLQKA